MGVGRFTNRPYDVNATGMIRLTLMIAANRLDLAAAVRRVVALALVALGLGGLALGQVTQAGASGHHAVVITIEGAIDEPAANHLARGLDEAQERGARLVVVRLDTPGGLYDSTRDMVESLLTSRVPVAVYVSPPGARAASAGTFIAAAAHVAAMAPGTNIGAASPVAGGGQELPETLKSKATQDAAAFIRSIADERGRNRERLEQTVLNSLSLSPSEALDDGVIDLIASDLPDLLAKMDGMMVSVGGAEVVLDTGGIAVAELQRTPLERFLGFLANPNVAFVLLAIGGIGILVELISPGLIVPGVVGIIALALAFVAITSLPVNWVGLGLILLAMVLLYLEATLAPGLGVFGIGAAISFIVGAFLLFGGVSPQPIESPSFRVNLWLIGVLGAFLIVSLGLFLRENRRVKAMETRPIGPSNLVGQVGVTTTELNPRGNVRVLSESWSAESDSGEAIPSGTEIIVSDVEGLTLKVFRAEE